MNKLETKRAEQDSDIVSSCEAGINAVLTDPLVLKAMALLDDVAAELLARPDYVGDPLASLRGQVLRSVSSIAGNIAEGVGRAGPVDVRRFYLIARGSAYESVIWLRALGKHAQLSACLDLCNAIDVAIIRLTRPLQEVPVNIDSTPGWQSAAVSTEPKETR